MVRLSFSPRTLPATLILQDTRTAGPMSFRKEWRILKCRYLSRAQCVDCIVETRDGMSGCQLGVSPPSFSKPRAGLTRTNLEGGRDDPHLPSHPASLLEITVVDATHDVTLSNRPIWLLETGQ